MAGLSVAGVMHDTTNTGAIVIRIDPGEDKQALEAVVPMEEIDRLIANIEKARTNVMIEVGRLISGSTLPSTLLPRSQS